MHTLKTGLSFAEAVETIAAARKAGSATLRMFTKDQDEGEKRDGVRESEKSDDENTNGTNNYIYLFTKCATYANAKATTFPRLIRVTRHVQMLTKQAKKRGVIPRLTFPAK